MGNKGKSKTSVNNRFLSAVGDEDDDDKKLMFLNLQFGPSNVLIGSLKSNTIDICVKVMFAEAVLRTAGCLAAS